MRLRVFGPMTMVVVGVMLASTPVAATAPAARADSPQLVALREADGGQAAQEPLGVATRSVRDEVIPAAKLARRPSGTEDRARWGTKVSRAKAVQASATSARYIVTFKPDTNRVSQMAKARTSGIKVTHEYRTAIKGMAAQLTPAQVEQLRGDPSVASVVPDTLVHAYTTQSPAPWGIDRTDQRSLPLSGSYSYNTRATNVTAYVIDSGVRSTHTQFGSRVLEGFDSVGDGWGTEDCDGHGTHVAGTIGGSTYGMAKGVAIVPVRVLDCSGSGYISWVIAGVDWVAENAVGPAVANMSIGGDASSALDSAVKGLIASGVTVVVAAGNDAVSACTDSPARVPGALTVGATTSSDARASFSNFGTCVDLFAPGSAIKSAWNTSNTATYVASGTSMASPHAAGAVALYLATHPTATPAEVNSAIKAAASSGKVSSPGSGSPNRLLYVNPATPPPPPPPTPDPLPVGVTASPIELPLDDGYADTSTVKVVSDVQPPGTPLPGTRTFEISGTPGTAPTFTVIPTRRSVDSRAVCAPGGSLTNCPDVQDIWTFKWDGRAASGETVEVGEYPILQDASPIATVKVTNLELAAVVANKTAPFLVAPYVDGKLDNLSVTLRGVSGAGTTMPTTGFAELTDSSGAVLLDRVDFEPTPVTLHPVTFSLAGRSFGTYRLSVELSSEGVIARKIFSVSVVPTEVTSAKVLVDKKTLYPYVDSYLDRASLTLVTTTSIGSPVTTTGSVLIFRGGTKVRSLPLVAGQKSVTWDGKVNGKTVPGVYTVKVTVKGPQGTAKTSPGVQATVMLTVAKGASLALSSGTVYPTRDGFRDSVRFTSAATSNIGRVVPGSVKIDVLKGSRRVTGWAYSTTGARGVTWNGRDGGSIKPGTYTVRLTVKGPEGAAVVRTKSVSVSGKQVVAKPFDLTMTPAAAFDGMATGTWWSGYYPGSQKLWGCTYSGCETDIAWYSWGLPSSFRGYSGVVVRTCTEYTSLEPLGRFAWTDPSGDIVGPEWRLGNAYPACYLPTSSAPASAFDGNVVNWVVGNVDTYELSYWEVKYFRITGTRYALE